MSFATPKTQVLSPADIRHFLAHGWVAVPDCFSTEAARERRDRWIREQKLDPKHPMEWGFATAHRSLKDRIVVRDFAPKAMAAAEDLVGKGRLREPWSDHEWAWGGFIVNVRLRRDEPWRFPHLDEGWHADGDFFHHFLDSPEQGLLTLEYFNDVEPHSGGTVVLEGSQDHVARALARHPEGLSPPDYRKAWMEDLVFEDYRKTEITGNAGTVVFCHPMILHASTPNTDGPPRFAMNATVGLKEPNRFDSLENATVVQRAIIQALGGKAFHFEAKGERLRYSPDRSKYEKP